MVMILVTSAQLNFLVISSNKTKINLGGGKVDVRIFFFFFLRGGVGPRACVRPCVVATPTSSGAPNPGARA